MAYLHVSVTSSGTCDIATVTDELILKKVGEIISSVNNKDVSDVAAPYKENVVTDMSESDVKERAMQLFL